MGINQNNQEAHSFLKREWAILLQKFARLLDIIDVVIFKAKEYCIVNNAMAMITIQTLCFKDAVC